VRVVGRERKRSDGSGGVLQRSTEYGVELREEDRGGG
jgi:hypothetical protein